MLLIHFEEQGQCSQWEMNWAAMLALMVAKTVDRKGESSVGKKVAKWEWTVSTLVVQWVRATVVQMADDLVVWMVESMADLRAENLELLSVVLEFHTLLSRNTNKFECKNDAKTFLSWTYQSSGTALLFFLLSCCD
jgi:hypothetical protein